MLYTILIYVLFIAVFCGLSSVGIYYLKASGRGSAFSNKIINLYILISAIIIFLTIIFLVVEAL